MWDYENVNGDRINGIVNICINFSCFDKCITVKTESEKNKIRKNKNSKLHSRNTDLVFYFLFSAVLLKSRVILDELEKCVDNVTRGNFFVKKIKIKINNKIFLFS